VWQLSPTISLVRLLTQQNRRRIRHKEKLRVVHCQRPESVHGRQLPLVEMHDVLVAPE
jgi:hypothetical protein